MKSLEKATADYEKAKEKMEASKARYEADLKRFKAAEIAKTEAENLEIVKIIRAMDMSIPELEAFKKRMKNGLPGRVEIQKMCIRDRCYHAHSVNYHYGNLVRKNDRNLPLYFHSTNSVCHHDQ